MIWREPRFDGRPLIARFETRHTAAACFGVNTTTIDKWVNDGLSLWEAERRAIQAGYAPEVIWPEWLTAPDRVLA